MEVGNRIREERERIGLSQEALSREVFVSRQTVSNWETGKTYPDVQSLLLLGNLFGVSIDSLVKGDVEAMAKEIENYELDRFKVKAGVSLSWALIVLGALMIALLAASGTVFSSPLYLVPLAALLLSPIPSFLAQRIEKRHDIQTLSEVRAFLDGADPDNVARTHQPSSRTRMGAQLAFTIMGLLLLATLFVTRWLGIG